MDHTDIPLLRSTETPTQALRAMRAAGRSGVAVLHENGSKSLLLGGEVAQAWKVESPTLEDLPSQGSPVELTSGLITRYRLNVSDPGISYGAFRKFFDETGASHAVYFSSDQSVATAPGSMSHRSVKLVTSSEGFMAAYMQLGAYICTGPPRHVFPEPVVRNGDACPFCASRYHATVSLVPV